MSLSIFNCISLSFKRVRWACLTYSSFSLGSIWLSFFFEETFGLLKEVYLFKAEVLIIMSFVRRDSFEVYIFLDIVFVEIELSQEEGDTLARFSTYFRCYGNLFLCWEFLMAASVLGRSDYAFWFWLNSIGFTSRPSNCLRYLFGYRKREGPCWFWGVWVFLLGVPGNSWFLNNKRFAAWFFISKIFI